MKPKEFYEKQRLAGLTYHITCNPNPNYNELFYQQIFDLMTEYAKLNIYNVTNCTTCRHQKLNENKNPCKNCYVFSNHKFKNGRKSTS